MITKLADLRNANDDAVLACMDEVKARGIKTAEFQNAFGTDYSYGSLSQELTTRGYIQKWVKPKTVTVTMGKNDRMNLNMTADCKKRFEKFLADKNYNFVHTTAAIMSYLDDVENGKIKVLVEMN